MTLLRVLHAEALKMKRTVALKMVVLGPAAIVLLMLFAASQAPFAMFNRNLEGNKWAEFALLTLRAWAMLMMPLSITLETALIAGLDHSENQWKSLLGRPVPRWTHYAAKLLVVMAMTAASTLVLLLGILIDGAILPRLQPQLVFGFPVPWVTILREGAEVVGLGFLALTIQHWVSLRWRSFPVAVSVGIVAMIVGLFAAAAAKVDAWPQYLPWALPILGLTKRPENIAAALLLGGALGLVVAAAGCADFCRREVS